jgi:hypothetical protein
MHLEIARKTALILAVSMLVTLPAGSLAQSAPTPADTATVSISLAFVTHLDMNMPEQDVFIERESGSGEVWRVTNGDNDMSVPLFAASRAVEHDPFNPDALGPYPRGRPLGVSLGEWLGHRGRGVYRCENGTGSLAISFSGLVPNGVYTIWHAFMALPPTTPFSGTVDLPLGARDGSESVFLANAVGRAEFDHRFKPCLQMSAAWISSMLVVNYHSDANAYLAHPGEFGLNAHVPLFIVLPHRADR